MFLFSAALKAMSCFPPEVAHSLSLSAINLADRLSCVPAPGVAVKKNAVPVHIWGLTFPNAVGLAAGLDKNGDYMDALAKLGFGFIEIGTLTPKPQSGNPKPRLFRLTEDQAIINRMGFNNKGIDYAVDRIKKSRFVRAGGILGVNIGKNRDTPLKDAGDDYLVCLDKIYPYASYITINLSSPNTPGLRDLQFGSVFCTLLDQLKTRQAQLQQRHKVYRPICIKIAPDMLHDELTFICQKLLVYAIDGVIATNTTAERPCCLQPSALAQQAGGLSGKPLQKLSTNIIRQLHHQLADKIPIIGVGGIMSGAHAVAKLKSGARLVQLYTGLVYQGPALISACIQAIQHHHQKNLHIA